MPNLPRKEFDDARPSKLIPEFELPDFELPKFDLPKVELPEVDLPDCPASSRSSAFARDAAYVGVGLVVARRPSSVAGAAAASCLELLKTQVAERGAQLRSGVDTIVGQVDRAGSRSPELARAAPPSRHGRSAFPTGTAASERTSRLASASSCPIPRSTALHCPRAPSPSAAALLIAGVATYAFFKVGTWAVGGDEEFKPISSLWFATFALAPGFFLPLEQELGRALAAPPGHRPGRPPRRRPRRAPRRASSPVSSLVAILAVQPADHGAATSTATGSMLRRARAGVRRRTRRRTSPAASARGSGRFRDYAVVMGSDGVVRIVALRRARRHRHHRRRRLRASPSPSPRSSASRSCAAAAACTPIPAPSRRGPR